MRNNEKIFTAFDAQEFDFRSFETWGSECIETKFTGTFFEAVKELETQLRAAEEKGNVQNGALIGFRYADSPEVKYHTAFMWYEKEKYPNGPNGWVKVMG